MALLSTVFKIPTRAQIGFLKLDASMRENHTRTATVTDNETEEGVDVSDHVKLGPKALSMECEISDVPVSVFGLGVSTDDFLGASNDFAEGDRSGFEGLVRNENRSPKEAWEYLEGLMENRIPFSVVTALKRYENMIIVSLDAPREAANGKSLIFTIQLREIRIVKSETIEIPAFRLEQGQAANSGSSKAGLGKQSAQDASETEERRSSLLLQGFQKAGVF